MNNQGENDPKRRRLIGHICAASAIIVNVGVSLLEGIPDAVKAILLLLSLAGYLVASYSYCLSKGRSASWFVMGLLGPVGLLLILFGPDYTLEHRRLERQRRSAEAARLAGFPGRQG